MLGVDSLGSSLNMNNRSTKLPPGIAELHPGRPGVPASSPRPPRGRGDAFEWREGEKTPPPPRYDSHRLDDDGGRRFGFHLGAPR
jgi:hypothetical protein